MVKGINKQIIEIKCTNSEYFDKILLFVCAEKSGELTDRKALREQALKVCEELDLGKKNAGERRLRRLLAVLAGISALVFAVSAGVWYFG